MHESNDLRTRERAPYPLFPCRSDKAPAVSGWQTRATTDIAQLELWWSQGFRAFGLPTGNASGVFCLDLDVCKKSGDEIGIENLQNYDSGKWVLSLPYVRTPTGGRHIYFQAFEAARNTTARIGTGIDTRGQGGYVISPGSRTKSGVYDGEIPDPGALPVFPEELREVIAAPPRFAPTASPGGVEYAGQFGFLNNCAPAPAVRADEVQELLDYIDPDLPYHDWVRVLMAVHDKFAGSEQGLQVADEWSSLGAKYEDGCVARRWSSFQIGGGARWPTVPAMAREAGADLSAIARRFTR